jgi:hypothetical protein
MPESDYPVLRLSLISIIRTLIMTMSTLILITWRVHCSSGHCCRAPATTHPCVRVCGCVCVRVYVCVCVCVCVCVHVSVCV